MLRYATGSVLANVEQALSAADAQEHEALGGTRLQRRHAASVALASDIRRLGVGSVGEEEHAGVMALRPEDVVVIAATGFMNAFIWKLFSQPFMQKRRTWAAVAKWPGRQLDRLGDWMYAKMPWLSVWPRR